MQRKNKILEINNNGRVSKEHRHLIKTNEVRLVHSPSPSPVRETSDYGYSIHENAEILDPNDIVLKQKWLDHSPRMSKLREHRQKRLINKLEVNKLINL